MKSRILKSLLCTGLMSHNQAIAGFNSLFFLLKKKKKTDLSILRPISVRAETPTTDLSSRGKKSSVSLAHWGNVRAKLACFSCPVVGELRPYSQPALLFTERSEETLFSRILRTLWRLASVHVRRKVKVPAWPTTCHLSPAQLIVAAW